MDVFVSRKTWSFRTCVPVSLVEGEWQFAAGKYTERRQVKSAIGTHECKQLSLALLMGLV